MADAGVGADPRDDGEPLADVVAAVERRRSERGDRGGPWERLDRDGGDRNPEQVWDRLANGEAATTDRVEETPNPQTTLRVTEVLSMHDKTVIGTTTALFLLAAAAVYLGTAIGLLPGHFWVLSLPLLTVGLILLVPVITYEFGVWDPADLGHGGEGTRDTSDIPNPDRIDHE